MSDIGRHFLEDSIEGFRDLKELGDGALAQIDDEELFATGDPEGNSVAILVKHMAGNMRSRWTDFLTTDGEKPDRNRDEEFIIRTEDTAESLRQRWNTGWQLVFDAIEPLTSADLEKTVPIRGEPHTIIEAIHRQLSHYAYHVGQMVFVARGFRRNAWKTLSVARGESQAFNDEMGEKFPQEEPRHESGAH